MTALGNDQLPWATIDSVTALRGLRDELACLAEMPGAASSIVQHPDWLLFELESRGSTASLHLVLARDDHGRIIGYAPFVVRQGITRVAFGAHQLPIYRGRLLRLLGAGVVAVSRDRASAESTIAAELQRDPTVRVIHIQETALPNSLATALSQGRQRFASIRSNLLDQLNWTIQPQESLAAYLTKLGSKRRNDLTRRLRNVYKKLGTEAQLRIFDAPEQIDDYCRLMNQVYARSWHAAALAIDWELPARRALFQQLARHRHMIGHVLMLGTRPIAYVHGYRLGGRYLLDDTGYDEEFAQLGVGSALVFQAIQDLLERYPGESIDFGYGDNQYKRVLADQNNPCGSLHVIRGIGPRICFQMITPLRWAYRCLRWLQRKSRATAAKKFSGD
ncbi:GNAT family N-acetyltransferase [Rhodanobacter koreensis]